MASTITVTPRRRTAINRCRALKERERGRARGKAAFENLKHALELVDTHAFWRMEKVDIADGAVYLIEKWFEVEQRKFQNKMKRVVEKRRRARETEAVHKLKELLMKNSKDMRAKMCKVDVLNAAASFLKSLVRAKRASTGSEGPSSPGSEIATSPISTPTLPSPSSSDSGNSSLIFGLSPEQNVVASLIQNYNSLQIRMFSAILFSTLLLLKVVNQKMDPFRRRNANSTDLGKK